MMSENQPVFRRLTVEGFRGFRDRMEFDLSASVVLLQGPNGTGKTSLFDAIQWLMLGDIGRLQAARMRQNTEHILNAYTSRQTAVVEADLILNDQPVALRRTGTYRSSVLEWTSEQGHFTGPPAEAALAGALAPGDLDLEATMLASGLMEQDAMRQILQTKPRDRYDQISEFLGLGVLQRFETQAGEYAARCSSITNDVRSVIASSEREMTSAQHRLQTLDALNAAKPSTQLAWQSLRSMANDAGLLEIQMPSTPTSEWAAQLLARLSDLAGGLMDLADRWSRWRDRMNRVNEVTPDRYESLQSEIVRLQAETQQAQEALAELQLRTQAFEAANDEVARLVAAALPLISGSACPVCGQGVDPDHLRAELSARAATATDLMDLRAQGTEAEERLTSTRVGLRAAEATYAQAQARVAEVARLEVERSRLRAETDALARGPMVAVRLIDEEEVSRLRETEAQCVSLSSAARQEE